MLLAAKEGGGGEILLFIHGIGTKPKSAILPASEEVREREEDCTGERGGSLPAVREQGQRQEKCHSGLNQRRKAPQVEEVIGASQGMSRKPPR